MKFKDVLYEDKSNYFDGKKIQDIIFKSNNTSYQDEIKIDNDRSLRLTIVGKSIGNFKGREPLSNGNVEISLVAVKSRGHKMAVIIKKNNVDIKNISSIINKAKNNALKTINQ